MPMTTQLGRIVAYSEKITPIKPHDYLFAWSCEASFTRPTAKTHGKLVLTVKGFHQ